MPKPRPGSCQDVATTSWIDAGYRPSKAVHAWKTLASGVNEAFPDKILAQNIIDTNDFPLIDENGVAIFRNEPDFRNRFVDPKDQIVKIGLEIIGRDRFAVQWQGLTAQKVSKRVLQAGTAGAIKGWQTNQFGGPKGSRCNGTHPDNATKCDVQSYDAILKNGLANGGRYIEVWDSDVAAFPQAIQAARSKFMGMP